MSSGQLPQEYVDAGWVQNKYNNWSQPPTQFAQASTYKNQLTCTYNYNNTKNINVIIGANYKPAGGSWTCSRTSPQCTCSVPGQVTQLSDCPIAAFTTTNIKTKKK